MSDTTLPSSNSQSSRNQLLTTVRLLLIALFFVVLAFSIVSLPDSFSAAQTDWQLNETAASLGSTMSYETLVAAVTGIELILLALYLATAALLLLQPPNPTILLATFTMLALPFANDLAGLGSIDVFGGPIASGIGMLSNALDVAGIFALVLLFFVFPNGRFIPRWLFALPVLSVIVGLIAIALPGAGDNSWIVTISALAICLLAATICQIGRYHRGDSQVRRQNFWFLIAALSSLIWGVLGFLNGSSLLGLIARYVPFTLLPIALVIAAWRGVWDNTPTSRQRNTWLFTVGVFSLVSVAGTAAWLQQNRSSAVDVSSLATSEPIPLILDVDMAMDDITALLYVLQHPGADLRAITVNGVAFAHCDGGVKNALGLLEIAGAPDIPVACGRQTAYPGGVPAPEAWRASADALYGVSVRTGGREIDPRSAAELFTDVVRSAPGEITVLAVGPLTNLAEAFEADPELPQLIKSVVIMGGAVDAPGNVINEEEGIDNQYAEWNFFADPVAADMVFESGVPIVLIPLDATNYVPFGRAFHQKLSAEHLTKPATFIYNLFYLNSYWLDGGMYWWDTLAVAAGLDRSLVTLEDATVDVVTEPGPEFGRTVRTPEGTPIQLATAADARRFDALLLALLNRQ